MIDTTEIWFLPDVAKAVKKNAQKAGIPGNFSALNYDPMWKAVQEYKKNHIQINSSIPNIANRPETLKDYIGQNRAKRIFERYVEVVKQQGSILPHTLIYGNAGCGKTTLARILANETGVKFKEITASSCKSIEEIIRLIKEVDGGIVFIDEIHGLNRNKIEVLHSIMEDFHLSGEAIKPFTLIVATTEYGELLKNRKPFCDRFKVIIELEPYTPQDIELLLRKYIDRRHAGKILNNVVYKILSWNSRNTPRLAIRLLETCLHFQENVTITLDNFNIIKEGYTSKDIIILRYLEQNNLAGVDSICSFANTPKQTYLLDIEPYLLQTGMIVRHSRGRRITQNGLRFLKSLSKP